MNVGERQIEATNALIGLEQVDLGHALDGDGEGHDDVIGVGGRRLEMRLAYGTKRLVARLAVEQLLARVVEAPRHDIARLLALDQIEQLVDDERRRQAEHAAVARQHNALAANRTPNAHVHHHNSRGGETITIVIVIERRATQSLL